MHDSLRKQGAIRPKPTYYQLSSAMALGRTFSCLANVQDLLCIPVRGGRDLHALETLKHGSLANCELADVNEELVGLSSMAVQAIKEKVKGRKRHRLFAELSLLHESRNPVFTSPLGIIFPNFIEADEFLSSSHTSPDVNIALCHPLDHFGDLVGILQSTL